MPSTGILDTYTAKAAYALRRLSSAYAGKCLRVRRSSDNTEQDIDFDGSGIIDWSAATTFASGGNLFVAKWYDQSGNSLDLVQATSGNQPQLDLTNHKISFTASSSQNLVCSTDFSSTNKFSAYSLFERNSSTGGYEGFWGYGSSGADFTELMYNLDLAGKAFFDYGGSAIYVSESAFSNNTFYTHSSIIDRSASPKLHHFRNGTEQTSITGTGATGNFPNGSLYIGSRQGNSGYSNCSFKEFIVFLGTAHGSTARSAVESDIDGGLGVTLPDAVPPTVSITSPSSGGSAISGNQSITATCDDDVHVTSLVLKVGGVEVETVTGADLTGHTFTLNTKAFPNGSYNITVVANDGHNTTESSAITKTFSNSVSITGAEKVAASDTETYTTDIPDAVWSLDSGLGSINSSTGVYTAPSSGQGIAVLRAESEFGAYATKDVLYGVPFEHNNANERTYSKEDLPAGYTYRARVKALDEQNNTLGYTDWVESPNE